MVRNQKLASSLIYRFIDIIKTDIMNQLLLKKLDIEDLQIDPKNPLHRTGSILMRHGNLIITNTSSHQQKKWIAICQHSSSDIYVCIKPINEQKDSSKKWFQKWYGQKYNRNGKIVYQGDFVHFNRHSILNKSKEFIYNEKEQIIQFFQGNFAANCRHCDKGVLKTLKQRIEGRWEGDNRQGKFKIVRDGLQRLRQQNPQVVPRFTQIINYTNDIETTSAKDTSHKLQQITFMEGFRYNVDITTKGYDSLSQGNWLQSSVVDFFFKHLNKSYNDSNNFLISLRCWTVFMFQKYIPSSQVTSNISPVYKAVSGMGLPFRNIISIFEAYPLMLMPLNQHQSHFVLGAIFTEVQRVKTDISGSQYLKSVKFSIYHFDSLLCTEPYIHNHLMQYIRNQISNISNPQQRSKFEQALVKCNKIGYEQLKFSKQSNYNDCGVFTCIFGALLAIQKGLNRKIRWEKLNPSIPELRKFIQEDMVKQNGSMLHDLIEMFVKNGIVEQ